MKRLSNLFFTEINFCQPKVIQGLDLNFNPYLLILLRGVEVCNNMLILSKYIYLELSAFIVTLTFIEISEKWCFKEYCSCGKAFQFSVS